MESFFGTFPWLNVGKFQMFQTSIAVDKEATSNQGIATSNKGIATSNALVTSSFLLLVVRPGAPSSVLAPSSDASSP